MKSTGIVRKVDELGRIVISEKDALEIYVEGDKIILHKEHDACVFCDSTRNLTDFKGRFVCADCLGKLKAKG